MVKTAWGSALKFVERTIESVWASTWDPILFCERSSSARLLVVYAAAWQITEAPVR